MLGSVFSPYYAWAGRRRPLDHVGLNVGLYGRGVRRWTLTERRERHLERTTERLTLGPSAVRWDGETMAFHIDERGAPLPRAVRGRIELRPRLRVDEPFALDAHGRHAWHPWAPVCDVRVAMDAPRVTFRGTGYLDANWGTEPLEDGFRSWNWARCARPDGGATLHYDAHPRQGRRRAMRVEIDARGTVRTAQDTMDESLPGCAVWRMPRSGPEGSRVVQTLEDTPFYSRSRLTTPAGEAVHESLDLDRFSNPIVRAMLPFRMPRRFF